MPRRARQRAPAAPIRPHRIPAITTKEMYAKMLSARNHIPARVANINMGAAIANVELDASTFLRTWFRVVSSAQPLEPFTNRD